jgi:ribosomal-protein-alanine N-acetyltransferase
MAELIGDGFILTEWQTQDAASLQKNANNINVSSFLLDRFPSPYTLTDAVNFIKLKQAEQIPTNFAIKVNGEVCGVIGVDMRQDIYRKTPLLGYWVSKAHRGKGIATQAVKLITAYAFGVMDIICIQALVLNKNPASMRVLEKAGYVKQAVFKQSVIKNGEVLDEHVYAAYLI